MFERSKLESLRDVSVTRIGDTLSFGFPQAVWQNASCSHDFDWNATKDKTNIQCKVLGTFSLI